MEDNKPKQISSKLEKAKEISHSIYLKTKEILLQAYDKTKTISQKLYHKAAEKTPQLLDSAGQTSKHIYIKSKQTLSSVGQKSKQYGSIVLETTKNISTDVAIYLAINSHKILKQNSDTNVSQSERIMIKFINDVIIGLIAANFAKLGIAKSISLIGFKTLGVFKGSLAAFYQSKIGAVGAKSLFALMQSIGAKSLVLTYAPVVVPTVVLTYAGYKVVVNVIEQKKLKRQKEQLEKQANNNSEIEKKDKNEEVTQIQISGLKDWIKTIEKPAKIPETTL